MAQSKRARSQQKLIAPNTSEEITHAAEYSHYKKQLPKSKTDLRKIVSHLCKEYRQPGEPTSVSAIHLNVFRRIYEIGMRENTEDLPTVKCPNCDEAHEIVCPICEKPHTISILDTTRERTSVNCLKVMADKWFPNKAPIAHEFDQVTIMEKISEFVSTILSILPNEIQRNYVEKWVELTRELEDYAD